MVNPSESIPDDERELDQLLAEYLRRLDTDEGLDVEGFLREHAAHAGELRELIDTAEVIKHLAGPRLIELDADASERTQILDTGILAGAAGDPRQETPPWEAGENGTDSLSEQIRPLRDFGDYQLLKLIGRGGMGVVFLARQRSLDRVVAIKMMRAGVQTDEDIRRFVREAQAAARLQHPHIVDIFEIGEINGEHFFSMEYVAGQDLSRTDLYNRLTSRDIAQHVRTVALAIEHAHRNQIIHRDLKPANIIIDEFGQPRVTDFGLAKDTRRAREMAKQGFSVGTPAYMSPEQASANDEEVGPKSDVYSLGAVLYALLAKRPPFRAQSAMDTLVQVLQEAPVPPSHIDPSVDRRLEAICLKCLQKEPMNRYATAAKLADDLERYLQDQPLEAIPMTVPMRVWYWLCDVPIVAALSGRPVRSPTLPQRLFQFMVPIAILLVLLIIRSQGCHPSPIGSNTGGSETHSSAPVGDTP